MKSRVSAYFETGFSTTMAHRFPTEEKAEKIDLPISRLIFF
jgi:hypothetical protein